MELYFAAMAFHGCFQDFKLLVASEVDQPQPSLISYLYKVFSFRLEQGLSKSDAVAEITMVRNNFRSFLYKVQAVTGKIDAFQTPFVSHKSFISMLCHIPTEINFIGLDAIPSYP